MDIASAEPAEVRLYIDLSADCLLLNHNQSKEIEMTEREQILTNALTRIASQGLSSQSHWSAQVAQDAIIAASKKCTYCFGEKVVHMSDGSDRKCEACNG